MKKNSALGDRFIEVMEQIGHTGYSFSRELETSEAVISNIRNGKNPPNVQLVCRLLNKYEFIDPTWLLLGKGHMFRTHRSTEEAMTTHRANHVGADKVSAGMLDRLDRIEDMLQKSFAIQVERAMIVDESIAELSMEFRTLSESVQFIKKDRRDRA